jgi:cobalt-zinc-cadmium efflux system membrane fusion protein
MALLLAVSLLLAACSDAPATPPKAAQPTVQDGQLRFPPGHAQLSQLKIVTAAPGKVVSVELPARLVWNEERTQRIYPAFAGRVLRITADVGQPVRPGSTLAQLASPDFGVAQAETAKAVIDAQLARKNLQRQRELFEAGIIARKELDQAEAEAARSHAETQRTQARTRLYGHASTVVERNLNPGQELRPDQMGAGAPPLFVISDPTSLWVLIDARETELEGLRPGATFELVVPSLGGQKFEGRVTASSDAIDAATRTIKVRGLVANPQRQLKAEMLATARVERSIGTGVVVPAQAVTTRGAKHSVLVQVQPGAFEWRDVVLGYQGPQEVVVARGLQAGEQVVGENMLLLARQFRIAKEAAAPAGRP